MKAFGIPVHGIPLCTLCVDAGAGRPATQKDLEAFQCDAPGCEGVAWTIAAKCHPDAGLDAEYCKDHGAITIVCHECHGPAVTFKVAP